MKKLTLFAILLLVIVSCSTSSKLGYSTKTKLWNLSNLSPGEVKMAHDLLGYGLEHEALYTLMDTLKPISSLGFALSYPIAKAGEMKDGDRNIADLESDSVRMALSELDSWNKVLKELSTDDLTFLLIPFRQTWEGKRNLQIIVCQHEQLSKLMTRKAEFFGQWGFTPNSNPATILTALEFEEKNDRYRAYGYLFGYPEHAVDFFVNASLSTEKSGKFVERDFFHMPVAAGDQGYFTYAIPKGYTPTKVDSTIYKRADFILKDYLNKKSNYRLTDGEIDVYTLISDYWKKK
ncbi:hypothetical protein [Roseivirga misakiensis]|uniref:Lipoprotein n=1 Tax=Roseivirga misakiensis TaxID=1563681 RepID=A0A1E5SY07_9BACT|nr:hypothetical protein [Roseivirga misakiensis]OEK04013.1 hypothetical protein BFP71_10985 [Roseivirga misakiensis]